MFILIFSWILYLKLRTKFSTRICNSSFQITKNIQRIFPNNAKTRTTYTGRKLGTKFQIKDLTKNQHEHDLIYYSKYPESNYNEDYLGETRKRRIQRTADHCGKDKQSHVLKHALMNHCPVVDLIDLKVINKTYHGNNQKRKTLGALYIKLYRPSLNSQEHSVQLKICN